MARKITIENDTITAEGMSGVDVLSYMIHATIAVAKDKGIPKEVYLSIIEDSWKAVKPEES